MTDGAVEVQACGTNLEELERKMGRISELTTECRQLDTRQRTMLDHNAQTLANLQVSIVCGKLRLVYFEEYSSKSFWSFSGVYLPVVLSIRLQSCKQPRME